MLRTVAPGLEPERRASPRYRVSVPIDIESAGKGVTHNISSTGLLFEVNASGALKPGASVTFRLGLQTMPGSLRCEGKVVRSQASNGRCVVAATINAYRFE